MARQLVARGERVDNVLLIDAPHAGQLLRTIVEFGENVGRRMRISVVRGAALRSTVALSHAIWFFALARPATSANTWN